MAAACGPAVEIGPWPLEGAAREVGATLAERFAAAAPRACVGGGETTVTVRGAGKGGRNQELALAFALDAAGPQRDEMPSSSRTVEKLKGLPMALRCSLFSMCLSSRSTSLRPPGVRTHSRGVLSPRAGSGRSGHMA